MYDDKDMALMQARKKKPSRWMLALFMIVFAVVGVVIIFRSFASDTPSPAAPQASLPGDVQQKAIYDTADYYGMNLPSEIFPDARGTDGDKAMLKVREDIAATGFGWVRTDVGVTLDRALVENTSSGGCGKALCDQDKLAGSKILAIIDHNTVNQIGGLPCGVDPARPPLEDLATWEKIVDCVSKRYRGKISAYEIWNEPTVDIFKLGYQDGSAEHYYNMLKSAYTIIKRNDPSVLVVGLGGVDIYAGGADAEARLKASKDFARAVASLGGKKYADVISVHGYSWDVCTTAVWDAYAQNIAYYKELWGKDVWMTETGQRSGLSCSQSQYIDYAYAAFINSDIRKVFWFALYDTADGAFGVSGKVASSYLKAYSVSPKTGQVRVETQPATPASISVHPGYTRLGKSDDVLESGKYVVGFRYQQSTLSGKAVKVPDDVSIDVPTKKTVTAEVNILTRTVTVVSVDSPELPAGKGRLVVRTNPVADARISIHRGFVRQWGVNWEKVLAGKHTVAFAWPNGTTTLNKVDGTSSSGTSKLPAETNVDIKGGGTTVVKVNTSDGIVTTSFVPDSTLPSGSGLIRVETSPAVKANIKVRPGFVRQWGVDWEPLPKGPYTVLASYLPTRVDGVTIKLSEEQGFEVLVQKIARIKLDTTSGTSTKTSVWK